MKKKTSPAPKQIASRGSPIITLLSDFGVKDPYVASMKGVILSICRKARIVDITHDIAKFDVFQGAYTLSAAIPHFPPGSIHVAVVDPGVGTKRKALIVETRRSHLIGPDNGVLMLAASREGILRVFEIRGRRYTLGDVSSTFHGRDLLCPVAAHLANGTLVEKFGRETSDYTQLGISKPSLTDDQLSGEVTHVDDFGNIVTNITSKDLTEFGVTIGSKIKVAVESVTHNMKFCKTYGNVDPKDHLALIGSTGFLEISVNRGNAALVYDAKGGTEVRISKL